MIISKTPVRVSFIGGGSDIPSFLDGFEGNVVSTTIDKYIYTIINKKHDEKVRISYSKTENVNYVNSIKNLTIKEALKDFNIKKKIELVTLADIPSSGSGLGSSSALLIGIIKALSHYNKLNNLDLVKRAYHIEKSRLKKKIGLQDACSCAFGGLNHFNFKQNGKITVSKINIEQKKVKNLKNNLLLFYTGINRKAEKILNNIRIEKNKKNIYELSQLALEFKNELVSKNGNDLGKIIHESWIIKKKLDKNVSSSFINEIYDTALKSGAEGGKILGAGGGGYFLFFAQPKYHKIIEKKLKKLFKVKFDFENNGSKIIYNDGNW